MKKRRYSVLMIAGCCLVLASVILFAGIQLAQYLGAQHSRQVLTKLQQILPERTPGDAGMHAGSDMPVLEVDGVDYAAVLEIPAFGVELPVTDGWDSKNLYCAPSRFLGSAYDQTLVIGGADSGGQFSFCDKIDNGVMVIVTDMTGAQFTYAVSRVDRAKHADPQWLMSADYHLTLFCRDIYSMEYVAVRCMLSYS